MGEEGGPWSGWGDVLCKQAVMQAAELRKKAYCFMKRFPTWFQCKLIAMIAMVGQSFLWNSKTAAQTGDKQAANAITMWPGVRV